MTLIKQKMRKQALRGNFWTQDGSYFKSILSICALEQSTSRLVHAEQHPWIQTICDVTQHARRPWLTKVKLCCKRKKNSINQQFICHVRKKEQNSHIASASRKRNCHSPLHSYIEGLWLTTNLILSLVLGIVSLSFFQKIRGGGTPTTRHSSLTGVPSGIPMFCSFSKIWGGCFISFSATDASFDDHYYYSLKKKNW